MPSKFSSRIHLGIYFEIHQEIISGILPGIASGLRFTQEVHLRFLQAILPELLRELLLRLFSSGIPSRVIADPVVHSGDPSDVPNVNTPAVYYEIHPLVFL